ncbi:hypothetical protein HPB49_016438 [Dermacentor silvarum]|uniref:Uncharacterized protein n=1 Tax=Dermacentor silvarum TaxID=543639 RepID=A0ACB8CYI5_DERSI|nr:hypothetical protein HPB49_016438 [Dermacentor silvarum]
MFVRTAHELRTSRRALWLRVTSAPARSIPSDPELWTMDSVKTAVIQLLREMSQSKLAKICPLKQSLLSTIVNNKFTGKLGAEKCKEFGNWFMQYRQSSPVTVATFLDEDKPPQDGRMTFHSTTELPRMREWFHQCPHPTSLQLQDFANQLNCESLRLRNKPKVTLNCLKNWWKNERQRERRVKRRSPGGGDEDSNPGSSAGGGSSSTSCPVPIKITAVTGATGATATPCIIHHHRSPPSPPTLTSSPQPSQLHSFALVGAELPQLPAQPASAPCCDPGYARLRSQGRGRHDASAPSPPPAPPPPPSPLRAREQRWCGTGRLVVNWRLGGGTVHHVPFLTLPHQRRRAPFLAPPHHDGARFLSPAPGGFPTLPTFAPAACANGKC